MSQPQSTIPQQPDPVPTLSPMAGFLSYLIPGLGQVVQGRISKGIFFMVVLLSMFFAGQAMGSWKNVYMPIVEQDARDSMRRSYNPLQSIYHRWHFAGQFFIGIAAWPAIWQFYEMPVPAESGEFWHDFQREPMSRDKEVRLAERNNRQPPPRNTMSAEGALNREIASGSKAWDVGWVYTVVAGVLNILVIYDAVAGPAFGPSRKTTPSEAPAEAASS